MQRIALRTPLAGLFLALATFPDARAAGPLDPVVLEAGAREIRILDDDDVLHGVLVDGLARDVYVYHPSPARKRVVYVTDRGRRVFEFAPGATRDFSIRFQGRLYPQRMAPADPLQSRYIGSATSGGLDVVPFRLGPDNAIHLDASINGSPPLDLIFDTGASVSVLSDRGAAKGAQIRAGPSNAIAFGGVAIRGAPAIRIDYRGAFKADGLLGFDVFAGKVVAIDYGRGTLTIGNALPLLPSGYRGQRIVWRGQRSMVPVVAHAQAGSRRVLALFDTGSKFSLSLAGERGIADSLASLPTLGSRRATRADGTRVRSRVVVLPALEIAGFRVANVQADVEQVIDGVPRLDFHILGNDFLKRFDVVIDYRAGELYLRPNALFDAPYNRPLYRWVLPGIAGLLLAAGLLAVVLVHRRRRS